MNDLKLLNSLLQSNSFSDALVRDTLDFSSPRQKTDTLLSIRWHFLLGSLPVDVDPENAPTHCTEAWRAIWSGWESISQKRARLCETRGSHSHFKAVKQSRFDPSSDSESESGDFCTRSPAQAGGKGCATRENPLRPEANSPYAVQYFIDQIWKDVKRDVDRLFWDLPIFNNPQTKCDITNILINFCFEEQKEYRQGLHEIVAFLYYICHRDGCLLETLRGETIRFPAKEAGFWDYVSLTCSSPSGLLSSTYALFKRIMSPDGLGLGHWFYNDEEDETQNNIAIVSKCVQSDILHRIDPVLQSTLDDDYDIQAVSYMVRWLRLLFLREFSFSQSALVWSTIFADAHICRRNKQPFNLNKSFSLFLAATMLHVIRDELCNGYVTALRRLMSYPPVKDICMLITKAASFADSTDLLIYIQPPLAQGDDCTVTQQVRQPRAAEASDVLSTRNIIASQGQHIASIIERLSKPLYSSSLLSDAEKEQFESNYLQALAELKKVRDALLFGVSD
ncbi:unnamed protein product [Phytomonas sp. EM1]|nr:unnamed protein product [Phytomonas sp. EM1]|eukprot:CCW65714.1 unnamed protein product [Phytomonas sp. isolate EM1]